MRALIVFLALFLSIYGVLHLYVLIKARRAFYLEGLGYLLLFVILVFLLIAPIHARILEAQDRTILSLLMTWVGSLWMGMIFMFVCLSLPLDAYHLFMALMQRLSNDDLTHLMLSRRQRFVLPAVLTFLVLIYGAYEAQNIRVETVALKTPKLPGDQRPIRLVQISDLHLGPMMFPVRLRPIVEAIAAARPDILISTGDLLDGRIYSAAEIVSMLAAVPAPRGKFAVTGNHEYYAGLEEAAAFTRNAGFTLLQDQALMLDNGLALVGVNDPAGGALDGETEHKLLSSVPRERFTLLLKHRPVVEPGVGALFDLQLSGHTHQGQMMPFGLLIKLQYRLGHGLRALPSGSYIYTSRGAGTWGPPFRFLAPPEITVIDLLPEAAAPVRTPAGTKTGP